MPCECSILNGVREFPDNLSYILVDSFTSTAPRKMRGLGSRSLLEREATVSMKVLTQSEMEMAIFSEWWVTELEYGTLDFTIEIPFFGIRKTWTAKITSDMTEVLKLGESREISIQLKIINHLVTAMDGSNYETAVGISEFPGTIALLITDGFTTVTPRKTLGLGSRSILDEYLKTTVKIILKTEADASIFLEWWVLQLNCGLESFTVNLPYNGITKTWNVIATNDLTETIKIGVIREITLNLKVLDNLGVAIEQNNPCEGC